MSNKSGSGGAGGGNQCGGSAQSLRVGGADMRAWMRGAGWAFLQCGTSSCAVISFVNLHRRPTTNGYYADHGYADDTTSRLEER